MKKILEAIRYATVKHAKQVRKYTGEPYIVHPLDVMIIVSGVPHTENMLCAAVLHDTIEDTDAKLEEISSLFGPEVAVMVDWLTDYRVGKNRQERVENYTRDLRDASHQVKTIKLADMISNITSIAQHDPNFARVYLKEKMTMIKALEGGNEILEMKANRILEESCNLLGI